MHYMFMEAWHMDTKELDNVIPEDERPAMILPTDPEESVADSIPETGEPGALSDPPADKQDEPEVTEPAEPVKAAPAEPAVPEEAEPAVSDTSDQPEPAGSDSASEAAVAKAADESKEKKKTMLRIGIIVGAFLLLIGLGLGWFFMMGPGATKYMIQFDPAGGKDVESVEKITANPLLNAQRLEQALVSTR